jgi:hypothetical protein
MNMANNVNGVGDVEFFDFMSLKDSNLVRYMDNYVIKLVSELNEFDNLHYEIANEPYTHPGEGSVHDAFNNDTMRLEWQQHVADLVFETETKLPNRHLISCNYQAGFCEIDRPLNHVDLYCVHYTNPLIVSRNYALNKAIGMNETGIMASSKYIRQCWETVLSGLALYNMLDYTFNHGHEDGTYKMLPSNPAYTGVEGSALRAGLKVVNDFINSFDFIKMRPAMDLLLHDAGVNQSTSVLAEEGEQYAVYHVGNQHSHYGALVQIGVKAPIGDYHVEIIDPSDGCDLCCYTIAATGGYVPIHWFTDKSF